MDLLMTLVAWMMVTSMFMGAVGGWLVFVVAWLDSLHTAGRLKLPHLKRRTQQTSLRREWVR